MYMTRIKQWDLCKNLRAEEKEALAAQLVGGRSSGLPHQQLTFKNRPVQLHRVLRHCKVVLRRQRRAASGKSSAPASKAGYVSDRCVPSLADKATLAQQPSTARDRHPAIPFSQALRPGDVDTHVEILLHSTAAFLSSVPSTTHPANDQVSASGHFWTVVKSAIYFLKKSSPDLAWPLLNEACQTPIAILLSTPVVLLRELFSTVSPVNTKMHGQVRLTLLRYLRRLSLLAFGRQHPLTGIIRHLEHDPGTRHASETGLCYLLSQHKFDTERRIPSTDAGGNERHSAAPIPPSNDNAPSNMHYICTLRALSNLHRRDHDLSSALAMSNSLTTYSTSRLGSSHLTTLTILTDHVHLLSDMCDYQPALTLAHQILESYRSTRTSSFPSDKACYVMEAIAELNHFIGEAGEEEKWLRLGLDGAWKVRGGDASVMFVKGKLEKLLDEQGRGHEALGLRTMYPEQGVQAVQ